MPVEIAYDNSDNQLYECDFDLFEHHNNIIYGNYFGNFIHFCFRN